MSEDEARKVVELAERRLAAIEADPALPPEFSEDALASAFVAEHGEDMRHVATWGRWLLWRDGRWRQETTHLAFDLARAVCRSAAAGALRSYAGEPGNKLARSLTTARTVAAVERMARADRAIATAADQWDAHPDLAGACAATLDLAEGAPVDPRREDYITRSLAVAPEGSCPLWLAFLDRVMAGDRSRIEYLQRMCGYFLTGHTHAQALFFLYGTGANGKSVFASTVSGVLGDYAVTAPMEMFTEARGDRHPTELALLRGARLVVANETEQGRAWAESRIKMLTGSDKIAARVMRGDWFEFTPTHKLLVLGNHKPTLRGVDEAIRRRLHLIPFSVTIPAAERDPALMDRLRMEWPGILQWMLDGCGAWRRMGLAPPPAVLAATAEYIDAEDSFGAWLAEATEKAADWAFEAGAALYANFRAWMERAGERPMSRKAFSQELGKRGYQAKVEGHSNVRGFGAIRLRRADYSEDPRSGG